MTANEIPPDSEPMLRLRAALKQKQLDEVVQLAREHPAEAMKLVDRMISISRRTDRLARRNYDEEIALLRRALNFKLTPEELDELKRVSRSRGEELQRRLGLRGLV